MLAPGPFVTQPELRPPEVRVTQVDSSVAAQARPRLVCLAVDNVIPDGTYQQGVMLVDRLGRLVWFEPVSSGKPFDAELETLRGKPVLSWWSGTVVAAHGQGQTTVVDGAYQTVMTVRAGDGLQEDLHDFAITSAGTALITAYQPVMADLSSTGGAKRAAVSDCHVQEIDLTTGNVLLDWSSLAHVDVQESYQPTRADPKDLYDYFHLNSVCETDDGNLLISGRNTWALYKLDRSTGSVIWRMGGKRSDFNLAPQARFAWQHHAVWHGSGAMTVFDNAQAPDPSRGCC